jgi:hypothetical protein
MVDDILQFVPQVGHVAEAKVQAIDAVAYQFSHAAAVGGDHRNATDERLLDRQWRVLVQRLGTTTTSSEARISPIRWLLYGPWKTTEPACRSWILCQ